MATNKLVQVDNTDQGVYSIDPAQYSKGGNIKSVDNDTVAIKGNLADYSIKATANGVIVQSLTDKAFKVVVSLDKATKANGFDSGNVKLVFADGALDLARGTAKGEYSKVYFADGTELSKKVVAASTLAAQLDSTTTYDSVQTPTTPSEGQSFTLVTGQNDTIIGTSDKNVITGTALEAGDIVIDQTAGDGDVMNLTLSAANGAARVEGIEQINVDWNAFGDATFDATNVKGAEINLTSSKVGYLGNATVTAAGANTVVAGAGIKNNLTVNGVTAATVNAGAAKTVTVNGTAATDDTATVTAGATTTNVTVAGVETVTATAGAATTNVSVTGYNTATVDAGTATAITLTDDAATDTATVKVGADAAITNAGSIGKLTLDIADGKTVTLDSIGADVTVTGAGNVTLKSAAVSGEKVLDTKTSGTLTVETSQTGALDLTNIAADQIKLTGAVANTVSVKSGANIQAAADLGAATFNVAGTASTDTINVTLTKSQATSTTFTGIETVNLVAAADQAAAPTVTDLTLASLVATGNTVNLSGSNDVEVTSLDAKVLDASNLTGQLKVGGTAATAADVTIAGAQGANDVTFNAAALKAAFVGQAGDDKVDFGALAATATATAVTGAGNDTVTANATGLTGSLSVDAGAGDDVVNLTATPTTIGTVVLQLGDGTDTLKLNANADLSAANLTITGLEKIKVSGDAIFNADQLSGKSFVVEGTTANAADTITAKGTASADTIDLSGLSMTDSVSTGMKGAVVNAGAGNDTIIGTSRSDVINGGAGADTMTGGAGADKFGIDSDGVATASVADVVTDFSLSAGDSLSFGGAAGVLANYAEGTSAVTDFAAALTAANAALNGTVTYVAEQVGSDTYVFYGTVAGTATDVVKLVGVDLAHVDATAIVA